MSGNYFDDITHRLVTQKGSGSYVILGIIILIIGIGAGLSLQNTSVLYIAVAAGVVTIVSAFLMIIRQFERAVILRLGKYNRQVGPGVQTRLPFADNILVEHFRDKVS